MHAIIDGDGPLYRAAAAAQHIEYHVWEGEHGAMQTFRYKKEALAFIDGREDFTIHPQQIIEEEYAAIHNIKSIMGTLLSDLSPRTYTLYLGGTGNYRYTINPEYKAGRPPRPYHYDAVKRYLIKNYGAEEVNGWEADDACSMEMHEKPDSVLVSNDKDLLMVPGHHYNWQKGVHTDITEDEGDYNFHIQLLTGDSTDNIRGLMDIGPARAAKILEGTQTSVERYGRCAEAYQEAGREDIEIVARQIWMSREYPDDWRKPE